MKDSIANYIKGCAMCQSRKNHPTNPKPPPFPITTNPQANPFEVIALDFITKLPTSSGYDTILTITDHDCSKAAIFIPCNEAIDTEHTALLYATYVLPHYGLPKRIISDHDTRFTAAFTRELCRLLQIEQNISTAYHPQTDGQSENTNKWVEQFLCIYINFQQTNWASLLPIAQYAHNSWPSATTKKAPFKLLMGHVPHIHQVTRTSTVPSVEEHLQTITEACQQAQDTIKHTQSLVTNLPTRFIPYCAGDRVWLEARNLTTTHPSAKLAPKQYRPFLVTAAVSRTSFRLKLPPQWKVHNVFHTSLLTPYKETPEHGPNFPEPSPDLINGEPEWEVEQVLNVRRWCNQLQYMVRWKGFSEAHDSWEPANNIHAEQLITDFYWKNPSAIRSSTHINQPTSPTSLTIRRITMSSPTNNSTPLAARISSPSPMNSVPLADRLSSPPLIPMDLPHRVTTPDSFPSAGLTDMEVNTPDPEQEFHFGIPISPMNELVAVCNVPTGRLSDLDARGCLSGSTTTKCVMS
jgi:transposase InsO family protein